MLRRLLRSLAHHTLILNPSPQGEGLAPLSQRSVWERDARRYIQFQKVILKQILTVQSLQYWLSFVRFNRYNYPNSECGFNDLVSKRDLLMSFGIIVMSIIIVIAAAVVAAVFVIGVRHDPHTDIRRAESSRSVQILQQQDAAAIKQSGAKNQAEDSAQAES